MVTKTVVAIIKNSKGEFLLQKKTTDYEHFPGKWGFFGGGIEINESPEEAIKRELFEESGIEFFDFKFFKKINYLINDLEFEETIFVVNFDKLVEDIRLGEGAGFAFFDKTELDSIDLFPGTKKILEKYMLTFN